jgi:hypothetical protein
LPADRLGDGKPRPNSLTALIEILDGNRLVKIFAQQNWQVVLCQTDQPLLSLQT